MYRGQQGSGSIGRGRGRGGRPNETSTSRSNYYPAQQHHHNTNNRNNPTPLPPPRGRGRGVDKTRPAWLTASNTKTDKKTPSQEQPENHNSSRNLKQSQNKEEKSNSQDNTIRNKAVQHNKSLSSKEDISNDEYTSKEQQQQEANLQKEVEKDDNDEELLKQLAANDEGEEDMIFSTQEEQEEQEARRLRQKRLNRKRCILDKYPSSTSTSDSNGVENNIVEERTIESNVLVAKEETTNPSPQAKEEDDEFDMFQDDISPIQSNNNKLTTRTKTIKSIGATDQDYDDVEGYYKANIGEIIPLLDEYKVLGIIGKGVFSNVFKCSTATTSHNKDENENDNDKDSSIIAMKIIRNNETMTKASQTEFQIIQTLQQKTSLTTTSHIVSILQTTPLEYRNHTIFLFEYLPFNLRQILQKFGSNVGLNLIAIQRYAHQLFSALLHLKTHGIIHADIKPDNILVSADYSILKVCDFGSAMVVEENTNVNNPPTTTPYLISRFYRPPEVILGLPYTTLVDLWSVGVTLVELYTGFVLFPGCNNNDMILKFINTVGNVSTKMMKRHVLAYEKIQKTPFFDVKNGDFWKVDTDRITHTPCLKIIPAQDLKIEKTLMDIFVFSLKKQNTHLNGKERVLLRIFVDLLNKCLVLDPARRIDVEDVLLHNFFTWGSTTTTSTSTTGGDGSAS